jgi:DNA topoisomerase-1
LFKLPRVVGEFEGEEVKANIGRYGPYILHQNKFTSIPKESSPYTIKLDEAIELIKAKRQADKDRIIQDYPDENIQVLKGRWGPFIKQGKDNFKIPKDMEADSLTLDEIKKIIEAGPTKSRRRKKKS